MDLEEQMTKIFWVDASRAVKTGNLTWPDSTHHGLIT